MTSKSVATVVWLALVLATGLSWQLGSAALGAGASLRLSAGALLLIAFVKVWLIGRHFMELRIAPIALRLSFDAWVVAVYAALMLLYLRAAN